jgi:CDP-6-deoxy-D-xylo-4-hexulose-3-dehydrase
MNINMEELDAFFKNQTASYTNNTKFIPGITPIYYSILYWDIEEYKAGINAFLNGRWTSAGENVNEFEKKFSKKFKNKFSLMVNSGSSANLILMAGLKKYFKWNDDDEIIVSPVGFPTSISVIYQNRLKPIFVDIELDTLNFDVNKIEEKITSKTRGIFVSPVLGNPPDMDKLLEICKIHNILLIGDNCDSLGTRWDNKLLNEYYVASSCSFYPAHHISCGEGGMISTDDRKLNNIFHKLSWWGRDCHCIGTENLLQDGVCGKRFDHWLKNYDGIIDHKYIFSEMGYNLKPLDLQGAIGIVQLEKFDEIEIKRKISKDKITSIFLSNVMNLRTPNILDKSDVCWFGTPFICEKSNLKHKLVAHLEKNKIQTRNYFAGNILLHTGFSFLDDYKKYPNANKILDNVFFMGSAPHYNNEIFQYIEDVVKKIKL